MAELKEILAQSFSHKINAGKGNKGFQLTIRRSNMTPAQHDSAEQAELKRNAQEWARRASGHDYDNAVSKGLSPGDAAKFLPTARQKQLWAASQSEGKLSLDAVQDLAIDTVADPMMAVAADLAASLAAAQNDAERAEVMAAFTTKMAALAATVG